MNKNKIVLFFPDGVGVRNYLYSNVFIDNKAHLTLLHKFDNQTITNFRNKDQNKYVKQLLRSMFHIT